MQHYLDHVARSRQRFGKIVKRLSEPAKSGIFIRGTALREPSVEAIFRDREARGVFIPFYVGTLSFFEPEVAAIMLDATLRKSVSYALLHLYKQVYEQVPNAAGPAWKDFISQLSSEANLKKAPHLAMVLFHIVGVDVSHIHAKGNRGCKGYEMAEVGDAYVDTLLDYNMQSDMLSSYQSILKESVFVSLPRSVVLESVRIATQSRAQEETMRLMEKINNSVLSDLGLEGLKYSPSLPILYRFCVEIEIAMMELMLAKLEE